MYTYEALKSEFPYYQEVVLYYKVNPCPLYIPPKSQKDKNLSPNCGQDYCFNFHDYRERRRPIFDDKKRTLQYDPIWCPSLLENGQCFYDEKCKYAHTQNEINYHPRYYKTEPCIDCHFEAMPRLCPRFHSDEINRNLVFEKFKTRKSRENSTNNSQIMNETFMQKGFNLDQFKTRPCTIKGNHNPKVCDYYHFEKDKRRPTSVINYSSNICAYVSKNMQCPDGDNCRFCHNKVEQLYHPERYKRKFCLCHPHNLHKCEYGDYCSFAHSEAEIKIELLHNLKKDPEFFIYKYKTVFCPYIYDHDRNQCVYAHNPQDFRRDPMLYKYNPIQCPNWSQGQIFSYEEGKCPELMNCEYCHGWKELEYHPMYYKTKNCSNQRNCTKVDCPFLHADNESNDRNSNSQSRNLSMGMMRDFGFVSPDKQHGGYEVNNEGNPNYYGQFKIKKEKKKESHFPGPIMPPRGYVPTMRDDSHKENDIKHKSHKIEGSTRPNSNVSSMFYSEEDIPRKGSKKKKKKQMSLQNKNEESKSPLSGPSSQTKGGKNPKRVSSAQINRWGTQNPSSDEKNEEVLEGPKNPVKLSGTKTNDSFESLQSYTIEKNGTPPEKAIKFNNELFKKTLSSYLKKSKLENTIPIFLSTMTDVEGLKSFSQKDFHLFPQVTTEDKEKVVLIIKKILEEENGEPQPNTVPMSPFEMMIENIWNGSNLDFLDNNNSLGFTKHPFN